VGTNATFTLPEGVAVDKAGNIYVADSFNNLIRQITPGASVTTLAGKAGVIGSANGQGINATFSSPAGVAVDNSGNVYVADSNNDLIRKIATDGTVSTLAGKAGTSGSSNGFGVSASFNLPTGLAVDNSGNVYVADAGNNLIRMITPAGNVSTLAGSGLPAAADGQGTAASFYNPNSIAIDATGTLYLTDEKNNLIRKISSAGMVTTIAGNGAGGSKDGIGVNATFSYPGSIAADGMGNLYVGDINTYLIRKIGLTGYTIDKPLPPGLSFDPTTGVISGTPAAASPATDYTVTAYNTAGSSSTIINLAVNGNIPLIPPPKINYQTPQIYHVNSAIAPLLPNNTGGPVPTNIYGDVTTFAGDGSKGKVNGAKAAASFNGPVSVVFDGSGNLFVSESAGNDIREIDQAGMVSTFAGSGVVGNGNGPGNTASFSTPFQLNFDGSGNINLADEGNNVIRKINISGTVSLFAGTGAQNSTDGTVVTASFNNPYGLVVDGTGNIYIADRGNSTIRKIDLARQVTTFAVLDGAAAPGNNTGLGFLATDASGNLFFGDSNHVKEITPAGVVNTIAGNNLAGFADGNGAAASFNKLVGIAVDALGNIYTGDANNNRIRKITQAGAVTTLAGSGGGGNNDGISATASFHAPYGVAVDNTGNYLYVADSGNNLIRKVAITGYSIDKSLPTGMSFDPTTGIISGTPAVLSPAITYTITAYNTGGSSSNEISIEVDGETVNFAPIPVKTICDADFDPGATGSGNITYTSANTAVATVVPGGIHITGAGTSAITASDGISSITQTLTVNAAVIPTITITPAAIDTCQGSTVTYTATITNGGANPVYQWQVNGQNRGGNSAVFVSNNLNSNDKITCGLTSHDLCTTTASASSNIALFTVDPMVSPAISIISTAAGSVCPGTEVAFIATAISSGSTLTYQWQVNGRNAGNNSPTFSSSNFANGDAVTCILTSNGKCLVNPTALSNTINVSLSPVSACEIVIPDAFTPNGDGVNDIWNITALQGYPGCTVTILNRYGVVVYNSNGYPKAWDGTYNGKALPVGTYYYIIDLKNGRKKLAGSVTILR